MTNSQKDFLISSWFVEILPPSPGNFKSGWKINRRLDRNALHMVFETAFSKPTLVAFRGLIVRRGLEFSLCVLNLSTSSWKQFWNGQHWVHLHFIEFFLLDRLWLLPLVDHHQQHSKARNHPILEGWNVLDLKLLVQYAYVHVFLSLKLMFRMVWSFNIWI